MKNLWLSRISEADSIANMRFTTQQTLRLGRGLDRNSLIVLRMNVFFLGVLSRIGRGPDRFMQAILQNMGLFNLAKFATLIFFKNCSIF